MPVTAEDIRRAYDELGPQPITALGIEAPPGPATAPLGPRPAPDFGAPAAARPDVAAPAASLDTQAPGVREAYADLTREANSAHNLSVYSPRYSYNPAEMDDRTTLQKYGLGIPRQLAGGLMDLGLGLAGMGIRWTAAGLLAPLRLLPDDQVEPILKAARGINDYVGMAMKWADVVAGRPVIALPQGIPLIGGMDVFRLAAPFALPTLGTAAATTKTASTVERFGKVLGFNIGFMTGESALKLATSENTDQSAEALKELAVGVGTGAAMTAFFAGIHQGVSKLKAVRADYAQRAMATSLAADAMANGDVLGDGVLRATEELRRMSGTKLTANRETLRARLQLIRALDTDTVKGLRNGTIKPGEAASKWLKDLGRASALSDSAVKDDTGQLIPVYRGVSDVTRPPDMLKVSPENITVGMFWAEDPEVAGLRYAKEDRGYQFDLLDKAYPKGRELEVSPLTTNIHDLNNNVYDFKAGGEKVVVQQASGGVTTVGGRSYVSIDIEGSTPSGRVGGSQTIYVPAPEGYVEMSPAGVHIAYLDIKNPIDLQAPTPDALRDLAIKEVWESRGHVGTPSEAARAVLGGGVSTGKGAIDALRTANQNRVEQAMGLSDRAAEKAAHQGKLDQLLKQFNVETIGDLEDLVGRRADQMTIQQLKQLGYDGIKHFGQQDGKVWTNFDIEQIIPVHKGKVPKWYVEMYAKAKGKAADPVEAEKVASRVMQTRLQLAIGKSLAAEKRLPLVEAEYLRRQEAAVRDAAGAAPALIEEHGTTTADPKNAAVIDLIRHAKAGGRVDNWTNPADGLPVFAPTKMPWLNNLIEKTLLRPWNTYITEEAATRIKGDVGQQAAIRHRFEQWRQAIETSLDGLFPYGQKENVGLLGQIGAASKNPLVKAMALEGLSEPQKYAIEKTIRDTFDIIGKETVNAGIMKEDELLADYFTRIFDPPTNQPQASAREFAMKKFSTFAGPIKKDVHTMERVFETFEAAINAGFKPKVNSLSAVVQSYVVSRGDSLATSLSRKATIDRLTELNLIADKQPSPAWVKIRGGGPELNEKYVPPDVHKMIRPIFEKPPDLAGLRQIDKINYYSKRYGLGLDFWNYMQGIRGVASVNANPFSLKAFYAAADKLQREDPATVERFIKNGLGIRDMPERIARDEVAERDRWLSGDRKILDLIQHPFYLVEEKTAKDIFTRGKLAAMIKEYYPAAQKMQVEKGRLLTDLEIDTLQQKITPGVNEIFGGLSYATMGRSPVARTLARLFFLSPDWTESRLRLYANAFGQMGKLAVAPFEQVLGGKAGAISEALRPENTVALRSATKLFAEIALATEVMNFAFNGHGTWKNEKGNELTAQLPFETRYGTHPNLNLWGYSEIPARMLYHVAKLQPEAFFNERNAPAVRLGMTWLANKDPFGQDIKGIGLPESREDQKARILLEKTLTTAGLVVPSFVGDAMVGLDRSFKAGVPDAVSLGRAIGNFVSIKVGSNYPTEIHERMDYLDNTEQWHRAEYKRLRQQGQGEAAHQIKRDWNDQVKGLERMIKSDEILHRVFGRRISLIERMKIE